MSVRSRVRRLEAARGPGRCPRCGATVLFGPNAPAAHAGDKELDAMIQAEIDRLVREELTRRGLPEADGPPPPDGPA